MAQTAKIFRSGNSQAVRLPKEFRFDVDEVEITREGDAVLYCGPRISDESWPGLRESLAIGLSDDFIADGRQQPPMPPDDPNKMFD